MKHISLAVFTVVFVCIVQGDSGGSLNCPYGYDRYYVAGITSWSIISTFEGRCLPDYPQVYTRTSAYLGWIARHLKYHHS